MPLTLDLPFAPTVNSIWRSGRGRVYRSRRYQAWRRSAGWELARQRPARILGPVSVTIAAGGPDRRRRDLDNVAGKAVLDLVQAHQVITDDSGVGKQMSRGGKRNGAERKPGSTAPRLKICTSGKSETARVSVASALLDRGYGKPGQHVAVDVTRYDQMNEDQLRERIAEQLHTIQLLDGRRY